MNNNFKRLFILLFTIFLSISGSFSYVTATTSSSNQNLTQLSSQELQITHSTGFFTKVFVNTSVIITATVYDYYNVTFINCTISFLDNNNHNDHPNMYVDVNAYLTIINSSIYYHTNNNNSKNYSLFRGEYSSNIFIKDSFIYGSFSGPSFFNIYNSKIFSVNNTIFTDFSNLFSFRYTNSISITNCEFSNPNPEFYLQSNSDNRSFANFVINIRNSTNASFLNNNFSNIPNLLYYDSYKPLNLVNNNFTNSQNVVYFQHTIDSNIMYNNFVNITNPFLISNLYSFGALNSSVNNYIHIPNIIKFDNKPESLTSDNFNFERNYYSDFSSLYLNAFGYYEEPYHGKYFIDLTPLSKPIEFYSTINDVVFLKTNSNYNLPLSKNNFYLINIHWLIIILFYVSMPVIPALVILIPKLAKLKKGSKRKHLKKIFETID